MSASAAAPATKEKTNEELCALIAQVMDILHEETHKYKSRSKQKRLVDRLKSAGLSPNKQHTGDFLWAYNWITTKFNKEIYNDTTKPHPNTGKGLIWIFYYHFVERYRERVFRSPEEMAATKARREARKAANAEYLRKKRAKLAEQKKISAKKKMAKEKQERLRLGGGNEEVGARRFQERMNAQSKEKDRKAAVKVSGDAQKLHSFWEWRLQTDEGKCYDIPLHAASYKSIYTSYGRAQFTKRFMLKPEDAVTTLQFLLNETDAPVKNPKITFKPDSTGKVHFYGMCHRAVNPNHHITMAPVVALHYKKTRRTPAEISGAITGCKLLNGEFYIQTKHAQMNTIPLLPPMWNDFKAVPDKPIGYKRYKAQPNRGTDIPFMLKILAPSAIETLEWTNGQTKYVVTMDNYGKDLAYVKSLCKTQDELEAEELRKMKEAADAATEKKKKERAERARMNEFWKKQTENLNMSTEDMSAYFDNVADSFKTSADPQHRRQEAARTEEEAALAWGNAYRARWRTQFGAFKSTHVPAAGNRTVAKFCKECGKGVVGMKFCQSCGTKTG